jgi:dimethylamine monooxygenase subunit C
MKNQQFIVQRKRKYLFLADQQGMTILNPIIEQAIINNDSFEVVFLGGKIDQEFPETDINQWLINQKMGTYLYVALPWGELNQIKLIIEEVGFSEEEYHSFGHGDKPRNVFCCRCHGITDLANEEVEISCRHCHLLLEVTDHYSPLHDAYLGYVAKL